MKKKTLTYLSCVIMLLYAMNITLISPMIKSIAQTYSVELSEAGLLFTTSFLGFVTFVLAGGFFANKFGTKRVLNVSFIGFFAVLIIFAFSPNFIFLCIASALMGGFGGALESLSSSLVSEINPDKPEYYINLTQIFFGIGAVVGPIGASLIVYSGVSWRVPYLVLAAISLVAMIIFLITASPETAKSLVGEKDKPGKPSLIFLVSNYKFILLFVAMLFYTGSEVGAWGWMSTFMQESLDFSLFLSAASVAVFWIAMTVGRIICGVLTKRISTRNIVIVLASVSSISTLLSVFVSSKLGIWLVIIAMGLGYSSQFPLIMAYGTQKLKVPPNIIFSILIAGAGVGSMTIPYLMGLAGAGGRLNMAMVIPFALLMMVAVIFLSFRKKTNKSPI